jgi:hypothetical protein
MNSFKLGWASHDQLELEVPPNHMKDHHAFGFVRSLSMIMYHVVYDPTSIHYPHVRVIDQWRSGYQTIVKCAGAHQMMD